MIPDASALTDDLTGIGTAALAVVTFLTLLVTIAITTRDRRDADRRLQGQHRNEMHLLQDAEAHSVEVATEMRWSDDASLPYPRITLAAVVTNHGRYPITGLSARFIVDGLPPVATFVVLPVSKVRGRLPDLDDRGTGEYRMALLPNRRRCLPDGIAPPGSSQ